MIKRIIIAFLFLSSTLPVTSLRAAEGASGAVSVAGLFPIDDGGRLVWNFNSGWRFCLGDVMGAEAADYDDSSWDVVTTPHNVKLEPAEASGCRNYQGVAWYRKTFIVPAECEGRIVTLHFEAIMGKQIIYVNGHEAIRHEGGYLPVTVDLTSLRVNAGDTCVVAVKADNSDDKTYPPGKTQLTLDFSYHGGIYRDVWLIARQKVAITDAIEAHHVAGGGVFIHCENISRKSADVVIETEVQNHDSRERTVTIENSLGKQKASTRVKLATGEVRSISQRLSVALPKLWSPETPYLYNICTRVKDGRQTLDGGMTRVGIRSIEFVRTDDAQGRQPGFYLNGERYRQLVGANRHQDFAYVGNALPNSQQWRDAKRLRDMGFTIIRVAHYPQDPSFMDACDELGLFVIVATPGWQFWNKMEGWDKKVHENTRQIIRRDRNHPSVLMWEPILNETRYPEAFALEALQITREEYPYANRPAAAADMHSAGVMHNYDVVYGWPGDDFKAKEAMLRGEGDQWPRQPILTREFGELVDDWYAHNNLNRASRSWGEQAMLTQAMSLQQSTAELFGTTGQFIGGCQWHPFDHQRGYHPDPYWGGDYDAFRQPKTAASMFSATLLRPAEKAVVKIAHDMTQFSPRDVTVFSNCDSVRLSLYGGEHCWTLPVAHGSYYGTMDGRALAPSMPTTFRDAWDFFEARQHSYNQRDWQSVKMTAEGFVGGKIVATDSMMPARRSTRLRLSADTMGRQLVADGSDFVVVVCEVTDDLGHVRRLAKENIRFTVEGEGKIIGDESISANPRAVEYGSAPVLIRSTRKAGKIRIHAEVQFPGTHAPTDAYLEIESTESPDHFCDSINCESDSAYHDSLLAPKAAGTPAATNGQSAATTATGQLSEQEKARLLQEVQDQQADFGLEK